MKALKNTIVLCSITLLASGCSTIRNPYITVPAAPPNGANYDYVRNTIALETKEEITRKIQDLEDFDFTTGALAIGTGIGAAALGGFGAGRDAVLGTAVGGATIIAARQFVPLSDRKNIYIQAGSAIECAILATEEDIAPPKPAPAVAVAAVDLQANSAVAVQAHVERTYGPLLTSGNAAVSTAGTLSSLQSTAAIYALDASRRSLEAVRSELAILPTKRANILYYAVRAIVDAANMQLSRKVLNPDAASNAAAAHLKGLLQDAKKKAEDAKTQADAAINNIQNSEQAFVVSINAAVAGGVGLQANALDAVRGGLESLKKQAEDVKSQADQILQLLSVPRGCFGDLLTIQ